MEANSPTVNIQNELQEGSTSDNVSGKVEDSPTITHVDTGGQVESDKVVEDALEKAAGKSIPVTELELSPPKKDPPGKAALLSGDGILAKMEEERINERVDEVKDQMEEDLDEYELMIQYLQSLLVWNLPHHLISIMIVFYLVVYYVDLITRNVSFFALMGIAGIVYAFFGSIKPLLNQFVTKGGGRIFYPQDTTQWGIEEKPLGLHTFVSKVKLYEFDYVIHKLSRWKVEWDFSVQALRKHRFSNPTRFAVHVCWMSFVAGCVCCRFSGRNLSYIMFYSILLLPGLIRRKVFPKLAKRIRSSHKYGRLLMDLMTVGENLNLEETNAGKIVTFIDDALVENRPKLSRAKVRIKTLNEAELKEKDI